MCLQKAVSPGIDFLKSVAKMRLSGCYLEICWVTVDCSLRGKENNSLTMKIDDQIK